MTRLAMLLVLTTAACLDVAEAESAGTEARFDDADIEAPDGSFTDETGPNLIFYGSTYNSNCFCLSCVKYCDVDGKTVKSGTCC